MTKYKNKKVIFDGIEFDSRREFAYYLDFKKLQAAGEITHLEVHPTFVCGVNGMKVCTYEADFAFKDKGRKRVIDVKSPATARLPVFRLKKKLVRALYGVDVEVVM